MSTIASHSSLNISETLLEIKAWFQLQGTTNRKWHNFMANHMVMWPMTSRDNERSNSWPSTLRAQYLANSWRCYLATIANYYSCCSRLSKRQLGFLLLFASARINVLTFVNFGCKQLTRSLFSSYNEVNLRSKYDKIMYAPYVRYRKK